MEQYSNLNVHGKIKQKAAQGEQSDDVVLYPTLTGRVPNPLPTPAAADAGKAIIVNSSGNGLEFGEAGKVDAVQINGTPIAGDGAQTKVANIPKAASDTLGVVKIGTNISIDSNGVISTPSVSATDSGSGNLVTGVSASGHALTVTKGISYSTGATQGHIVQRGTGGQITVPSTPSADTDAASKAFVNSSVSTNTATFRGTYNAVSDLGNTQATVDTWTDPPSSTVESTVAGQIVTKLTSLSITPTNNDYVFVSVDQTPVGDLGEDWYWRFKYNGTAWGYEYTLNNSSFTQAQWDAVNSGITADKVSKLDGIEAGAEVNVNADWNASSGDAQILNKPTFSTGLSVSNTNVVTIASTAVTSGSYGPTQTSATTLAYSGTFKVPKYTVGADGRLTASEDIQFTLPASDNTDAKVQQKGITTNSEYPILLKYDANTTDVAANYVNFAKPTSKVPTINASTGAITAAGGFVGNASTATNVAWSGITSNPIGVENVTLADM